MNRTLIVIVVLALGLSEWRCEAATINSIDFMVDQGQSVIEIKADSGIEFQDRYNEQDKQVIVDIPQATLARTASRPLDTSSFQSPVTLISPYQLNEQGDVRVVMQLRDDSRPSIGQINDGIRITMGQRTAAASESSVLEPTPQAEDPADINPRIEQLVKSRASENFKGKPVTLKFRNADVRDVLRMIAEVSGFNLILGPAVTGKITISLEQVPWDQALDVILHTMNLGAERNKNILRVLTLQNLTKEKQEELDAKLAQQASAPRITKVFPISYADPNSLQSILTTFASGTGSPGKSQAAGIIPLVQVDSRTNSIIVQDIPENIERMKELIRILDTQTPQVLVEAKIVEASESFSRSITGGLGVSGTSTSNPSYLVSFSGSNPVNSLIGSPGVFADGNAVSSASNEAGLFAASPTLSFLPGVARLNALLAIGEAEAAVKVVSAPKTVVLDKESATILQSTPVIIEASTVTDGVPITTKQILQANVSLNVLPTVTNDESVMLQLNLTRDVPQTATNGETAVANRNMSTKVLVDSGSTLVIGGIYTMDQTESSGGFPLLRHIPIFGVLFGTDRKSTSRSELFIFVTPRILNVKKAGLVG